VIFIIGLLTATCGSALGAHSRSKGLRSVGSAMVFCGIGLMALSFGILFWKHLP